PPEELARAVDSISQSPIAKHTPEVLSGWRRRGVWIGLALLVFVTAPGGLESGDAAIRLETAKSLLDGQGGALGPGASGGVPGRYGASFTYFNFGQAFILVPFLVVGKLAAPRNPERVAKFLYGTGFLPLLFVALALILSRVARHLGGGEFGVLALL